MQVTGPARAISEAFSVEFGVYRTGKEGHFLNRPEEYRGHEGEVKIPPELAGVVTGVFGLDLRRVAHRRSPTTVPDKATLTAALSPHDLENRYLFPDNDATGQTVAIAEFGGGYFPDDVAAFCQRHGLSDATASISTFAVGLPVLTPQQIQGLPSPQRDEELGASVEVMMDIEIAAGLARGAKISVYFAPFTQKGWVDLLNQVIIDRPVSLSVSWGSREDDPASFSTMALRAIDERLAAAATLGITVCVSSGDDGSGDNGEDNQTHVDFPAASAFVLGVGGTMLENGQELAWRDPPGTRFAPDGSQTGGGASGGGISVKFHRPAWQNVHVNRADNGPAFDGRVVPDVAALAGRPFYSLVFQGQDSPNGGTSASAPLWASLIARVTAANGPDSRHRFLAPLLYGHANACQDVLQGDNTSDPNPGVGYRAEAGYDAVTGLGTPIGTNIVALLQALP